MNAYRKAAVLAASLALAWSVPGMAQTDPFVPGDYVEVSSVTIDGTREARARAICAAHGIPVSRLFFDIT